MALKIVHPALCLITTTPDGVTEMKQGRKRAVEREDGTFDCYLKTDRRLVWVGHVGNYKVARRFLARY